MQSALPSEFSSPAYPVARATSIDWRLGIPTYVYAVVFASLCIVVGLLWDIMWHISIGRDGLFSAPHLVMYVGALVSGLFSGCQILSMTLRRNHPARAQSVNFWGVFYGSLGAMFCAWGALAILTSAPFDDWWHNTYGLDVQILTPPHTVLVVGMLMVQLGAIVAVLAVQNQPLAQQQHLRRAKRTRLLFSTASAFMLSVLFILLSENISRYASHHSSYYVTAAVGIPLLLLAFGRAAASDTPFRYPITTIAAIYMLLIALPSWILPLFPAVPKLSPVANPITHYQAYIFPLLLIIPGYALDRLMNRLSVGRSQRPINDWLLAAVAGALFMLTFLAVQWPFGGFLHESPYARNWFFMSNSWPYDNDPTWAYRFKFGPWYTQTPGRFALNVGQGTLIAMVSARLGLFWGNWMRCIVR